MLRRHYERGFSLLEAVVALGVASFALVSAYAAFTGGLANLRVSHERAAMALLAEDLISAARSAPITEGELTGLSVDGYSWRQVVQPYESDETQDGLVPVELTSAAKLFRISVFVTGRSGEAFILETLKVEGDGG